MTWREAPTGHGRREEWEARGRGPWEETRKEAEIKWNRRDGEDEMPEIRKRAYKRERERKEEVGVEEREWKGERGSNIEGQAHVGVREKGCEGERVK